MLLNETKKQRASKQGTNQEGSRFGTDADFPGVNDSNIFPTHLMSVCLIVGTSLFSSGVFQRSAHISRDIPLSFRGNTLFR